MKINLQGTYNTRDLGGIVTEDGRIIKERMLIRSDALTEITAEDEKMLKEHCRLSTVVDLRTYNELSEQPPGIIKGVSWVHMPLLRGGQPAVFEKSETENDADAEKAVPEEKDVSMAEIFRESIAQMNYDVPSAMKRMYDHLFSDDYSIQAIRSFFDLLLWHCTAGKDRTGVLTLLLLGTLGVSKDTILEDYVESGENLRPQTEGIIEEIKKSTDDEVLIEQSRILNSVLPEYVDSMYENIEALGGDIPGYMKKVIGITDEDIDRLKKIYLE